MSQKRVVCPRCANEFPERGIKQHYWTCKRIPKPEELCQQLDRQPALSARGLCREYKTSHEFLYKRLEGTRWSRRRLLDRSRRCQSLRQVKRARTTVAAPRCVRCELLLAASDLGWTRTQVGDLCWHCLYELREIARRIVSQRCHYGISRHDFELFRRWDPGKMKLL